MKGALFATACAAFLFLVFLFATAPERPLLTEYTRSRLFEEKLEDIERRETETGQVTTITGPVVIGPGGMTIELPAGATLYFLHAACRPEELKTKRRVRRNQ